MPSVASAVCLYYPEGMAKIIEPFFCDDANGPDPIGQVPCSREILARDAGLLPHEYLLLLSRGLQVAVCWGSDGLPRRGEDGRLLVSLEPFNDARARLQAANAAAPYFAPRLAAQILAVKDVDSMSQAELEITLLQTLGLKAEDLC